jgi:hypothetical protein
MDGISMKTSQRRLDPYRFGAVLLRFCAFFVCIVAAACHDPSASASSAEAGSPAPAAPTASKDASPPTAPQPSARKDPAVNGLAAFVPAGAKILDSHHGDLDGRGGNDMLLVIDPARTGQEKLGDGELRIVVLLTRNDSGTLQKAAENARIIPCSRCGGLAGDPYAYARIEKGTFTVSTSGGSRERWTNDFTFQYAAERQTWLLHKVLREVTDTATEQRKSLDLSAEDFGTITFEDFDPGALPEVEPLEKTN